MFLLCFATWFVSYSLSAIPLEPDTFFDLRVYAAAEDNRMVSDEAWDIVMTTGVVPMAEIAPDLLENFLLRHPEMRRQTHLTREQVTAIEDARISLSLFDEEELDYFFTKVRPDLAEIRDQEGFTYLTTHEVSRMAYLKFMDLAEEKGIDVKNGINEAVLSGQLNIPFSDLRMVFAGIGRPSLSDIRERWPGFLKNLIDQGQVEPGEMPHHTYLQGLYQAYRDELWTQEHGSFGDIESVKTSVAGQMVTMSGQDLGLRMLMRLNPHTFERSYGLKRHHGLRYEEAIATLKEGENPDLAFALEQEVKHILETRSLFSYYNLGTLRPNNFDLRKDYQDMRNEVYVPAMQEELIEGKLDS